MREARRFPLAALWMGVCGALGGVAAAFAQEETASSGNSSTEVFSREPSLMILIVAGILVAVFLVTRLLLRLKVIKNAIWTLPILVLLSGAGWGVLALLRVEGVENLYRLVRLLFLFMVFLGVLVVLARLAMPSEAQRTRAGSTRLIQNLAVLLLAILGFFILLMWSFPGLPLTPVFVTSGAVSIIIGLAVQDHLGNLLAGVVLSFDQPFQIGDWVQIGEIEGQVTEIGWRATRLRTRNHIQAEFPNHMIAKERVLNFERPTGYYLMKILVGVTYETPPGLVVHALLEAAARTEGVRTSPASEVHFKDYQDSCLLYEARMFIDNFGSRPAIESDARKEIWYAFKRHGITIPFPQRDVNFRQIVEPPQALRGRLVALAGMPRGTTFELGAEPLTIGREPSNRVCITDPHVSGEHAVLEVKGDQAVLRDLKSRSGTHVNGAPITCAVLHPGDEIRVGAVTLVFETNLRAAQATWQATSA